MVAKSERIELTGAGAQKTTLAAQDGKVVVTFDSPCEWAAFDPAVALQLAHQMISAVQDCGHQVTIEVPKPKLPETIRVRMQARVAMILNNKREAAESTSVLAIRIVDTILNMVEM
jgi:hypothetical protein